MWRCALRPTEYRQLISLRSAEAPQDGRAAAHGHHVSRRDVMLRRRMPLRGPRRPYMHWLPVGGTKISVAPGVLSSKQLFVPLGVPLAMSVRSAAKAPNNPGGGMFPFTPNSFLATKLLSGAGSTIGGLVEQSKADPATPKQ